MARVAAAPRTRTRRNHGAHVRRELRCGQDLEPQPWSLDTPPAEDIAKSTTEKRDGESDKGDMVASTSSTAIAANVAPGTSASASATESALAIPAAQEEDAPACTERAAQGRQQYGD